MEFPNSLGESLDRSDIWSLMSPGLPFTTPFMSDGRKVLERSFAFPHESFDELASFSTRNDSGGTAKRALVETQTEVMYNPVLDKVSRSDAEDEAKCNNVAVRGPPNDAEDDAVCTTKQLKRRQNDEAEEAVCHAKHIKMKQVETEEKVMSTMKPVRTLQSPAEDEAVGHNKAINSRQNEADDETISKATFCTTPSKGRLLFIKAHRLLEMYQASTEEFEERYAQLKRDFRQQVDDAFVQIDERLNKQRETITSILDNINSNFERVEKIENQLLNFNKSYELVLKGLSQ